MLTEVNSPAFFEHGCSWQRFCFSPRLPPSAMHRLNNASFALLRVLFGILTAIDMLHEAGFVQRDIKPDNILVGQDGGGILADFGLCITKTDACLPEFLGDGTADYSAPEITSKLSGSTLCTELYSWFVVFVESMMMRHPFAGEVRP